MKKLMLGAVAAAVLAAPALVQATRKRKYAEVKEADVLERRRKVVMDVKEVVLKGWVANRGDDAWHWADELK